MQLTKKASYGVIAMLELARADRGSPISAATIAAQYSLPASFVEKILHQLKRRGLVASVQGRSGGYYLARSPEDLSVRQVLEALDESIDLVGCLGSPASCQLTGVCPTKSAWERINRRVTSLLDELCLADLLSG
jgi:Rrf2 family iron-sulfur cluster assembly transcriptional regulator